ncbi:hypothetical protein M422DRAFT_189875, partial [Sphaerobolus stellatus SS14]
LSLPRKIHFGDNSIIYMTGQRTIVLQQNVDDMSATTTIKHALLVPSFKVTLLLVCHLTKGGYYATFEGETAKLQQCSTHQTVMTTNHNHGLYHIQATAVLPKPDEQVHIVKTENVLKLTGTPVFCAPCI